MKRKPRKPLSQKIKEIYEKHERKLAYIDVSIHGFLTRYPRYTFRLTDGERERLKIKNSVSESVCLEFFNHDNTMTVSLKDIGKDEGKLIAKLLTRRNNIQGRFRIVERLP